MRKNSLAAALLATASLTLALPASAQVGRFDPGFQSLAQSPGYTEVRFDDGDGHRRGGFHHHRHHWHGNGRHGRYGGGLRHHHHRGGFGIGAGIAGLAAGAIIGGAIASQAASSESPDGNAVAYCSRKFKFYDPSSGTYLGYNGHGHACPNEYRVMESWTTAVTTARGMQSEVTVSGSGT